MRNLSGKKIITAVVFLLVLTVSVFYYFCKKNIGHEIRHVVLISIDTCRADYLSCYGFDKTTTPNIDSIAAEGILFENVIAPAPITLPSHSSMLTGTIPPYHGVHDNYDYRLGESNLTLAEILKDKGFSTGGIVSAFALDTQFGIGQGFDSFNDRFENLQKTDTPERIGGRTSDIGIEWIEQHKDENFFLFLHYFDPHMDYNPPEPFATKFVSDLYAGEIAYTDHCIGRVIGKLKELGIYDSTLIVITSDHGEMLGEHGESTHSFYIYQGAMRVPLIFKLPGEEKHKRIEERVGLIDIVPTICGLLGIDKPEVVQGQDISGFCIGEETKDIGERYLYCESFIPSKFGANPLLGVVNNRYKYIQAKDAELYDLLKDPKEFDNLAEKDSQRARIFEDKLQQILEKFVTRNTDSNIQLDAESLRRLESLGYVGGGVEESFEFDPAKEDHKDVYDLFKLESSILVLSFYGKYEQAKKQCEKLIARRPNLLRGHQCMVDIAIAQEDIPLAETHNLKILEIKPDYARAHNQQGLLYHLQDRHNEAISHFRRSLELGYHLAQTYDSLGVSLTSVGKFEEAVQQFQRGLEIKPDNAEIVKNLGLAYQSLGEFDRAATQYQLLLKQNPDQPAVLYDLAGLYFRQGEFDMAVLRLEHIVKLVPDDTKVLANLARAYYHLGKFDLVIEAWGRVLEIKPDWPEALNARAWMLAACRDPEFREPQAALKQAARACELTGYKTPSYLMTLAAAHASNGNFKQAVEFAEKAKQRALTDGIEKLVSEADNHLELYRKHQPYHTIYDNE